MTGFQSKKALAASRHADDETIEHIIELRKENAILKATLQDIVEFYEGTDKNQLNNVETIIRLRAAINRA
jgi:hypothetical protein